MWRRILTIAIKETRLIIRDRIFLALILLAPLISFIVFTYAINNDYHDIPVAVYNYQYSSYLNDFIASLSNSKIFNVKYFVRNDIEYQNLMKEGKIKLVIIFPDRIDNLVRKNKTINIQTIVDGSNSNLASMAGGYLETLIQYFNKIQQASHNQHTLHQKEKEFINLTTNILYNKDLKTKNFIVPGLISITILSIFPMLLGFSINGEREAGTLNQVLITTIKTSEFFIGKVIPIFLIEVFIIFTLFLVSIFWFNVKFVGNLIVLILTIIIFTLSSLAMGLLMSSLSKTRTEVSLLNGPIAVMPTLLLSGFVFPIINMPRFMQFISNFVPAKYSNTIMRNIFLKGSGLNYLYDELLLLTILGVILLSYSIWNFNRTLGLSNKGK